SPELAHWRLRIVGEGRLEADLKARAARLGLTGRVDWLGQVTDPVRHYFEAGVFVLPSRYEGMPNALMEAMGARLPAIISDASPGPKELIRHEVSGLVVAGEDVEALVGAMERLARDEALRERMGAAARQQVEAFAFPHVVAEWERLIGWQEEADIDPAFLVA
ncbi:MAG: glycosyltransferase, partial [Verrucomicrobiota bacterium]